MVRSKYTPAFLEPRMNQVLLSCVETLTRNGSASFLEIEIWKLSCTMLWKDVYKKVNKFVQWRHIDLDLES